MLQGDLSSNILTDAITHRDTTVFLTPAQHSATSYNRQYFPIHTETRGLAKSSIRSQRLDATNLGPQPPQRQVSPQIGKYAGWLYTETIMVPLRLENTMPTTLTLKNIPDEVYERLKVAAEMHRRSLNSEAIVCLESVLTPTKIAPSERLARARQLRAELGKTKFRAREIDTLKRQGRP